MITSVDRVAENFYLDVEIAREVAKTSTHVFLDGGIPVVSTWWHDEFVAEVRFAQGGAEASAAIRKAKIAEIRGLQLA